jgi:hypothetical protein
MDRSKRYSVQIGNVSNESLAKVTPLIKLIVIPIFVFILTRKWLGTQADFEFWSGGSLLGFFFLMVIITGFFVDLWKQHIQILRFGRCEGDSELYYENSGFLYFKQINKRWVSKRFRIRDIEEFQLTKGNSVVFIKVNSEIFNERNGENKNSISLDYIGDLSTALMIYEKIELSFLQRDHSIFDVLNEVRKIRFQNLHISDLKKHISLNQRQNFIKKLFNGEKEEYFLSIEILNSNNEFEAMNFLQSLGEKYHWKRDCEQVFELTQLVNRRFL